MPFGKTNAPAGKPATTAKPAGAKPATTAKPATAGAAKPAGAAAPKPAADTGKAVLDAIKNLETVMTASFSNVLNKFASLESAVAKAATAKPAAAAAPAKPAGAMGKSPVAATTGAAKPAAAAAKPGSATGASSKPAASQQKSPAVSTATAAPSDGEVPSLDELKTMSRKQLSDVARALGIDPAGTKAQDLVEMIDAKRGEGGGEAEEEQPAEEEANEEVVEGDGAIDEMVAILMGVIENNYEVLKDALEGDPDPENGVLGCGGDCARCPNPEGHPTPQDQIRACFTALHEHLGLEVPELSQ